MKIKDIRVIVTSPGQNFVTVKIITDEGIYGVGDATLNGRELAVATYLEKHVVPCLLGRDASRIEDIWQYLYRGGYWRRGPVTMAAISAIDMALWDIKAKACNMPLYQLLGGASREKIMIYTHAHGSTIEETVEAVVQKKEEGFQAIRVQCGVPGLDRIYGISKLNSGPRPDGGFLPDEDIWSTEKYLPFIPKVFERLRDVLGWDTHLLHDAHHRLSPIEAARLGKDLEPYRLFWLEDAVAAEDQENFRHVRNHTTTPLAVGEVFNSIWDARDLIREQLIDYIRTTSCHAGGVTGLRRIFDYAAMHNVKTGCHGPGDVSPITMGVNTHLGLWVPNYGIQEFADYCPQVMDVFPSTWTHNKGFMHPGDVPGHGVDIDEELAARFPYERAYLPVNRLEDGTLWHW
ncbi:MULTISPECIES: D-mannonate dehydratase ManD [Halocynthiibacter]|uniref:D-galactonate dehydratase family protein n=1 Tax=Halocynthiibacter halioticoli TaxID=2986804 RepID=A0AAE3IVQ2_9RHOB|nr:MULTISPECIES: D-mannonate dehydratase ManD [Halocynthiibacter]MCV6822948.1 D-galactonate dehydratase family protein [Halocynthiibacter halioticoli]MCW4055949.1 D-galactonate dehydratase family protein [Halocynthiibacter sp. SDUM655004]